MVKLQCGMGCELRENFLWRGYLLYRKIIISLNRNGFLSLILFVMLFGLVSHPLSLHARPGKMQCMYNHFDTKRSKTVFLYAGPSAHWCFINQKKMLGSLNIPSIHSHVTVTGFIHCHNRGLAYDVWRTVQMHSSEVWSQPQHYCSSHSRSRIKLLLSHRLTWLITTFIEWTTLRHDYGIGRVHWFKPFVWKQSIRATSVLLYVRTTWEGEQSWKGDHLLMSIPFWIVTQHPKSLCCPRSLVDIQNTAIPWFLHYREDHLLWLRKIHIAMYQDTVLYPLCICRITQWPLSPGNTAHIPITWVQLWCWMTVSERCFVLITVLNYLIVTCFFFQFQNVQNSAIPLPKLWVYNI